MIENKDDIEGSDDLADIFESIHALFRRRKSKEMKAKNLIGFMGNGGGGGTLQTEAQDRFGSNLIFAFEPYLTQTLRQEAETSVALTLPTTDGDLIGCVQDTSLGHWVKSTGATLRPAYGLSGGKASIRFDGTNDRMVVDNSLGLFKNFWNATPTGTIMFRGKMNADTANAHCFISSNDGTGGKTGITFRQTTGDKLQFFITKAGPNVVILNYTSSATINLASGVFTVIVTLNGVGVGNASVYINGVLDGTGTILAGVSQDASDLMRLGEQSATADQDLNGEINLIYFTDHVISADDRTWFTAFNPDVDAELFPFIPWTLYDGSDATKMFTERSSPATNVSANNDPVGYFANGVSVPATVDLKRDATASSDAVRPLYKTNAENGKSVIYFDGQTSKQELNHTVWMNGGCLTWIIVERFLNESAPLNEGRKLRNAATPGNNSSSQYTTQTAFGDASNTPPLAGYLTVAGESYFVYHIGGTAPGIKTGVQGSNGLNIGVYVQVGSTVTCYNHVGQKTTWTVTGAPNYRKIGGIDGTWTNNRVCEDRVYVGIPGGKTSRQDAAVATIIAELKTKWGVV